MSEKRQATLDEQRLVVETYHKCEAAIRYNIYKLLPYNDMLDDCIQETLIIAFDNIDKFLKSENKEGWLHKAATYAAYRMLEVEEKYLLNTVSINEIDIKMLSVAAAEVADEVVYAVDDSTGKKAIIRKLKRNLTKSNGEFLELYLEKSRSTKELATITGHSEATIRSKMKRLFDGIKDLPPEVKENLEFL